MKKIIGRLCALGLSLCTVLTMAPATVWADNETGGVEDDASGSSEISFTELKEDKSETLNFKGGDEDAYQYFTFTPDEDGTYYFYATGNISPDFALYSDENLMDWVDGASGTGISNEGEMTVTLTKGTYYLRAWNDSEEGEGSYNLTVSKLSFGDLIQDESTLLTFDHKNSKYFTFTTGADETAAGTYYFYAEGNVFPELSLYSDKELKDEDEIEIDSVGESDSDTCAYGSYMRVNLKADTTYYLRAWYSTNVGSGSYTLKVFKSVGPSIKSDGDTSVEVQKLSGTTTFSVTGSTKLDDNASVDKLTYQWSCYDPETGKFDPVEGVTGTSITIDNTKLKWSYTRYQCVAVAPSGEKSDEVEFGINLSRLRWNVWGNTDVRTNPDGTATLKAIVDKETTLVMDFRYQWYRYDEDNNWSKVDGATDATYTAENAKDGQSYRCVVTDSKGLCDYATYDVNSALADIDAVNGTYIAVNSGESATPKVSVTPKKAYADSATISYRWQKGTTKTVSESDYYISREVQYEDCPELEGMDSVVCSSVTETLYYKLTINISVPVKGEEEDEYEYITDSKTITFVVDPGTGYLNTEAYTTDTDILHASKAGQGKSFKYWTSKDYHNNSSSNSSYVALITVGENEFDVDTAGETTLSVTPVDENANLTYSWSYWDELKNSYVTVDGASESSYTVANSALTWRSTVYRCTATDTKEHSDSRYFYLNKNTDWSVGDSEDQLVDLNSSVDLSASLKNAGSHTFSYQWYKYGQNAGTWGYQKIDGATEKSCKVNADDLIGESAEESYACVVTDENGIQDMYCTYVGLHLIDVSVDKTYYSVSSGADASVSLKLTGVNDDVDLYCTWYRGTVTSETDDGETYSWVDYNNSVEEYDGETTINLKNVKETVYLMARTYGEIKLDNRSVDSYVTIYFVIDPGTGYYENSAYTDSTSTAVKGASAAGLGKQLDPYGKVIGTGSATPGNTNPGTTPTTPSTGGAGSVAPGAGAGGAGTGDAGTGDATTETPAGDTTVTTNPDGSTTETTTGSTTNTAGNKVDVTTTTEKDKDGNVTGSVEIAVIDIAEKNSSATVTVTKTETGEVKAAEATVTQTGTTSGSKTKVTLSTAAVSQIQEQAGQKDVDITVKVLDDAGKTKYTVKTDAENLQAGNKLYAYALNTKTGEYTAVDSKTYTVSKSGNVSVSMSKKATYELVDAATANKISKKILATVKAAKSSKTVKKGKKATFTLSSKLNQDNVKSITYTTSKKSVATVSKTGKITTKKAGTVTVKAKVTLKNGKTKTVSMKVKVKK